MFDLVIQNARICDGTGRPSFLGSSGRHGTAALPTSAARRDWPPSAPWTLTAWSLAPGFIDPHTHYDAQVAWDPLLTSSPWHGVTTVVMGNCGVGVAPVKPGDARHPPA